MASIGLEELTDLLHSGNAVPDAIQEQLEAWDIDPDAWQKWAKAITETTMENPNSDSVKFLMLLQFWMGFELGYRLALENEMRRMV